MTATTATMTAQIPTGTRPVVVGVDGSASAFEAVRWAAVEAERRAAPLRLVMVFAGVPDRPRLGERYRKELLERSRKHLLSDAVTAAEWSVSGLQVSAELVVGSPIATLHAESRRAQLLVLGSRGLGGVGGLFVGSVTVALAAHAACPVVVVRGDDRDALSPEPVVVGVDGTPTSEAAIAFAFDAAAARGVPLVAVHTWSDFVFDPQLATFIDWAVIERNEQVVLSERLAGWSEKYPDVPVTKVVERGSAADELVERSKRAQLVVVGSRGRGNFIGLVLGSVSHGVLHRSHCPVAVIRPGGGGG